MLHSSLLSAVQTTIAKRVVAYGRCECSATDPTGHANRTRQAYFVGVSCRVRAERGGGVGSGRQPMISASFPRFFKKKLPTFLMAAPAAA